MNPLAIMREPFGVEEHQRSRFVCEPLHLLDYCLINDGAACVIVTTAERARDCKKRPVYIGGMQPLPAGREEFIWSYPGMGIAQQSVFDYQAGARSRSTKWRESRPTMSMRFSPTTRFRSSRGSRSSAGASANRARRAAFTQDGRIEVGGELPMNTNGGLLSESHMMAWNHQVEIVRQLRGECGPRQVTDARIIQWANAYGDSLIYHV